MWGVDSSDAAIKLAEENKKLNKISDTKLIFKKVSAEHILDALCKGELPETPDFILVDPPNFVRNKKHLFKAKRLYIRILKMAMKGIERNGYIGFSTCSQLITDEIFNEIIETAAIKSKRKVIHLYTGTQAKDHPVILGMNETKYLRFCFMKII